MAKETNRIPIAIGYVLDFERMWDLKPRALLVAPGLPTRECGIGCTMRTATTEQGHSSG